MTNATHAGKGGWAWSHSIVMAIVVLLFFPWWWGGKVLAPLDVLDQLLVPWRDTGAMPRVHNHFVSDAVTQYLPYRWLAQESLRQDGYIGWNNLTAGGLDQSANTMALAYDWTMQLHRWFDFWTAWHLGLMGQFILAGCGMLVFLRSRGIGPWFALPAAVVFLINFQFIAWLYHRWALSAFCWVPWLLWALMGWREGRKGRWILVPFFLALGFLGGTLQHAAFVVLLVSCFWLAWMIQDWNRPPQMLRTSVALLILGGAGIVLASPMFWPCIQAYWNSVQGGQVRGQLGYPGGGLQPVLNLVSYLGYVCPHLLGSPDTMDGWKLFKSELFNVAYFGGLPFVVALAATTSRRFPLEPRVLLLVGFLVPLTPLVGPLYHRVALVGITGGVWLFAHALQHEREWLGRGIRRLWPVLLGLVAVWVVVSVLVWWRKDFLQASLAAAILHRATDGAFGCLPDWMVLRGQRWIDSLLIWDWRNTIPLLAVLGGLRLVSRRPTQPWWGLALTALLVVEVGIYAGRWITYSVPPSAGLFPETEETKALRSLVGNGMIHLRTGSLCDTPFPANTLSAYGIRTLEHYESILPRGMQEYLGSNPSAERLSLCGVTHLVVPATKQDILPGWVEVWRNPKIAIYENAHRWPRYCALPPMVVWSVQSPQRLEAPVEIVEETQNHRRLRVPGGAGCIRVAENWSANWEYTVDGQTWKKAQRGSDGSLLLPVRLSNASQEVWLRYRQQFWR